MTTASADGSATALSDESDIADLAALLHSGGILHDRRLMSATARHRRSRCFSLALSDDDRLFLKQAVRRPDGSLSADVTGEGARHRTLHRALPDLVPPVVMTAPHVLVTPHLDGVELADAPTALAPLGRALAALHACPLDLPAVTHAASVAQNLLRPSVAAIAESAGGFTELVVALRAHHLAGPIDAAAASWRSTALVHGDLKSDNVLCAPDGTAVTLIDWETAGRGDARWDVGCVVGDAVFRWLRTLDFTVGTTLAEWLAGAAPLSGLQDQLRTFLAAYREAGGTVDAAASLRFGALFLLQRATGAALLLPSLPRLAMAAIHLAGRLLTATDEMAEILL